ncbi:hypothetical protein ABLE68_04540 [Nocardioides sp. CN2-186]|uniref:divisome protein SepX/GlpR n=1 Tax=Nocardioides tweenelious TaxID=3156607 RepID=UPI0032B3E432
MDPSALIFVALAVAWAAYLVPLALKRHDEASNSRSVDRFSHTMRVLARREPVNRRSARLVVTPGRPAAEATVVTKPTSQPEQPVQQPVRQREMSPAARRAASKRATKRRRNVLAMILVVNLVVVGVAAFGVVDWWYVAAPVGLLAAWLVACRVMVKGERRSIATPTVRMPMEKPGEDEVEAPEDRVVEDDVEAAADEMADPMADTSTGMAPVNPELWDPVPVTLPTYVSKPPAARRTVRTISIDDSGVWSSGRTDADAQIAREADAADKAARKARNDDDRAVGS